MRDLTKVWTDRGAPELARVSAPTEGEAVIAALCAVLGVTDGE